MLRAALLAPVRPRARTDLCRHPPLHAASPAARNRFALLDLAPATAHPSGRVPGRFRKDTCRKVRSHSSRGMLAREHFFVLGRKARDDVPRT